MWKSLSLHTKWSNEKLAGQIIVTFKLFNLCFQTGMSPSDWLKPVFGWFQGVLATRMLLGSFIMFWAQNSETNTSYLNWIVRDLLVQSFKHKWQLISKWLKVTMRQGKDAFKTGEGRREQWEKATGHHSALNSWVADCSPKMCSWSGSSCWTQPWVGARLCQEIGSS